MRNEIFSHVLPGEPPCWCREITMWIDLWTIKKLDELMNSYHSRQRQTYNKWQDGRRNTRLVCERHDDVAEICQTLVDVLRLLEALALRAWLFQPLAAGQIDQVEQSCSAKTPHISVQKLSPPNLNFLTTQGTVTNCCQTRRLSQIFLDFWTAVWIFQLISGLAEFTRKVENPVNLRLTFKLCLKYGWSVVQQWLKYLNRKNLQI